MLSLFETGIFPGLKVFLLVLAAISHYAGVSPPTPPASKEDIVYRGQPFEHIGPRLLAFMSRMSVITWLACECAVIVSLAFPTFTYSQQTLSILCPGIHPSPSSLSSLSPSFLLGLSIMLASGALRVWCFKTLGNLFTFEVSIQRSHKLITSGPYAYVRHPSYTAIWLMSIGAIGTCFATGSYVNECKIMATPAGWWIRSWVMVAPFSCLSLWRRGKIEDTKLRSLSEEKWERYREAVPYMFVPGLF